MLMFAVRLQIFSPVIPSIVCFYSMQLAKQIFLCSFSQKGIIELSATFGFLLGAPIGGGLQEVRELGLSPCMEHMT